MACYEFGDTDLLEMLQSADNNAEEPKERIGLDFILEDAEGMEELLGQFQIR